jgi:hypothetical protein
MWVKSWRRTTDLPLTETPKQTKIKKRFERMTMVIVNKLYRIIASNPHYTQSMKWVMFSMVINRANKVLYAPDAIHFLDGVDNVKSTDMEMAFKVDENYENVVKAWSFVIEEVTVERLKE